MPPGAMTIEAPGKPPVMVSNIRPEPPERRRCTHPGTRVIGGYCKHCDAVITPDGYLPG